MAEEVEISNVGEPDGVASEATLKSLADAIKKLAAQSGKNPKSEEGKLIDTANKARKSGIKVIHEESQARKPNNESIRRNTKAMRTLNRSATLLGGGLGLVLGTLGNLTKELLLGGERLSSFTQHIPVLGSVFTPFVGYLEESLDAFRDLSVVGASFGNSMLDIRRAAAGAAMPLDEFVMLVRENSTSMAALGTGTSGGAREFARLSRELRQGVGRELMGMGFTVTELNAGLADFIDFQNRQVGVDRLRSAGLVNGTAQYLQELDELARVTGLSRRALMEQMNENQRDARIRFARAQMSETQQLNFDRNMSFAAEKSESFANVLADMVDGRPDEELSRRLYSMSSVFRNNADNIKNMNTEEMLEFSVALTNELEALGVSMGGALEGFMNSDPVFREMFNLGYDLADLRNMTAQELRQAQAEARRRDRITTELGQFEESIREVKFGIQEAFINSGVFDLLTNTAASLAEIVTSDEGLASVSNIITQFKLSIEGFVHDVQTMGLWETLKQYFLTGVTDMFAFLKRQLLGGEIDNASALDFNAQTREAVLTQRTELRTRFESGEIDSDEYMRMMEQTTTQLTMLDQQRQDLEASHGEHTEGFLAGLFGDIDGTGVALTGLGVALAAFGVALAPVSVSALALGAAVGMAAGGLGYAFQGLSDLVENLEPLFDTTFKGIQGTMDTIGKAIENSIIAVGNAVSDVVTSLTEYKTATTQAQTDQIVTLSTIDATNLQNAATAIEDMKTALDGFSPSTLTTLTSWATGGADSELMASTTTQITTLATALVGIDGEKLQTASTGVAAMGTALVDFAKGLAAQSAAGILESIAGWFSLGDDQESVVDKIIMFGEAFARLPSESVIAGADAITALAGGINALGEARFSEVEMDYYTFNSINELSMMGPGLAQTATQLQNIANVQGLETNLSLLNTDLDSENISSYTSAMQELVAVLRELNEELSRDTNGLLPGTGTNAGDVVDRLETISVNSSAGTEELNRLMSLVVGHLSAIRGFDEAIERNTRGNSRNLLSGPVTTQRGP